MAITNYVENDMQYWQVYINLRSRKNPRIRLQKRLMGLESEAKAKSEEKKLIRELSEKLVKAERLGSTWSEVIDRWQDFHKENPSDKYVDTTIDDHVARLRNYTVIWLNRPACELNRGDGREVLSTAEREGARKNFLRRLKNTINVVYKWGIEERLIPGVHQSPVHGLEIQKEKEDKPPEILTRQQICQLLVEAKRQGHSWYNVWAVALLTGMRSGELNELKWSDIQLIPADKVAEMERFPIGRRSYGLLRVTRTWNTRHKKVGPTKGGYWRTVPVSSELYKLLTEIRSEQTPGTEYVLPRFSQWRKGGQAKVLRMFCLGNSLPSIKFHTLRACWATQLITDGVSATRVMKIGGWKDIKTMQRYIRMAGIEEMGATESLEFLPSDDAVMEHAADMFGFKCGTGN